MGLLGALALSSSRMAQAGEAPKARLRRLFTLSSLKEYAGKWPVLY
ncbi:MAG TPA: hypothetical protein VFR06_04410 [Gallionellaceae bacterium]|nr:hypothetical protein [Gallionellaceae bacterium]